MSRLRRETLADHPTPPSTPLEALAHALAIYASFPDEKVLITCTTCIYPGTPWTGLRLGDLRQLLADHADAIAENVRAMDDGVIHMSGRRVTDVDLVADFIKKGAHG
ncbi:hypothetical protein ACIOHC_35805 [Streptomyces sp. NPDC088252]|uniref:hypothetical protein n=1 Tax=Streptomyces sp. NPDC088252 TaxID=3365845 RepID=UPI00380F90AF